MLHATLPLGVRLDQCFSWVAALAQSLPLDRRHPALSLLQKLIKQLGETEITVQAPLDHILCQTCDELRRQGKHEEVAEIEELIQYLKGGQQRVISGSFALSAKNLADLDGQLESLRKVLIAGQ